MKPYLVLVLAPLLVQCGSSSGSNGSSNDSGADGAGDGGEDVTSSSSGGVTDSGSSSGAESGSSGSGSGGGDGAVPRACKTATTTAHLSYTVGSAGSSDVITLGFDADATWAQQTPMPSPWWDVSAHGLTCEFTPEAELRLGGTITGADGGTDGGISLPTTAITWTIAGGDYPQSATDGAIFLGEITDSSGVGNYWLAKSGQITGMPVGTDCYELDFTNVSFGADPRIRNPSINQATGSFTATGMARVGTGCP
jgi:hypothetical protein